uniref:Uncharacterized protein n=1 Tax=Knipowitschia caucasica TaxID=637954 RepID=A0AAV2KF28_KNICA
MRAALTSSSDLRIQNWSSIRIDTTVRSFSPGGRSVWSRGSVWSRRSVWSSRVSVEQPGQSCGGQQRVSVVGSSGSVWWAAAGQCGGQQAVSVWWAAAGR